MASVGKYRKKIKSAKNIAKITKAMQLVAASKMRKAQVMALSGKEYSDALIELSGMLSKHLDKTIHPLIGDPKNISSPSLVILVAPEKGLCGGLVTNISRFVAHDIASKKVTPDFIAVGAKAKQVSRRLSLNIVAEFPLGLSYPTFDLVPPIARLAELRFINGDNSRVSIIYAEFFNTMVQKVVAKELLPLEFKTIEETPRLEKQYLFEPTPEDIVNSLLSMYLETEIYHMLLEAYASEQSARMVAMKNATDNAKGLIEDLTIEFNKVRQSMITSEILDIGNQQFING